MDEHTNSGPDRAELQNVLYRYLLQTLRLFPAESALSLVRPDNPQARLHGGVVLPGTDPGTGTPAEVFDISYWVTGIDPEAAGHCFDLVVNSWTRAGWQTRTDRDSPPRAGYTRTPEQFGLSVRENIGGAMSLSGTTPPFAIGSPAGRELPEVIEHPLAPPE